MDAYRQQAPREPEPNAVAGRDQKVVGARWLPTAEDVFPVNVAECISVAHMNVTQTQSSSS